MILHLPTRTETQDSVTLSARFEMELPLPNLPETLWYRFPKRYAERTLARADGFVPTALLVAMYAGENLRVCGPISPQLAYQLYEYQKIFHTWDPKFFQRVEIEYDHIEAPPVFQSASPEQRPPTATAFSGGVDSFYTLWAHLEENQPIASARVTHGLFVHGLDLRLDDPDNYQAAAEPYSRLFEELGLELIQAATNAYQFAEFRVNWTMFFGAPTIGAALLLGPWLRRFYMPSGMPSYLNLFPQSSSPLVDHLLSTEATEIVHHAASISRFEKVAALAAWPATHHKLRVCSDKVAMAGLENCSACHKCYRTMVLLELLDRLPQYNNFSGPMRPVDYLRWGALTHLNTDIAAFVRTQALKDGRVGMGVWVQIAIILQLIKRFATNLTKHTLGRERLYQLKRRLYPPEAQEDPPDGSPPP